MFDQVLFIDGNTRSIAATTQRPGFRMMAGQVGAYVPGHGNMRRAFVSKATHNKQR